MIIDYLSHLMVLPFKRIIDRRVDQSVSSDIRKVTKSESRIRRPLSTSAPVIYASGELGKEISIRSTRDRIARGLVLNILMLFGSCLINPPRTSGLAPWQYQTILRSGVIVASFAWWRFQFLSSTFKARALATLT